jgi:hypothetical protein
LVAISLGAAATMGAGAALAQAPDAAVVWSVVNRFRLFRMPPVAPGIIEDVGESSPDQLLDRLEAKASLASKIYNPAEYEDGYNDVIHFLEESTPDGVADIPDACRSDKPLRWYQVTYWKGAGPNDRKRPCAVREYDPEYLYRRTPRAYQIRAKIQNVPEDSTCIWSATDANANSKITSAPMSCARRVLIPVSVRPGNWGSTSTVVTVKVLKSDGADFPVRDTPIIIQDRLIVGLGDSFGSGEGNPDRPDDFSSPNFDRAFRNYWKGPPPFWAEKLDPYERWWNAPSVLKEVGLAQWWDPICHRSLMSQQFMASLLFAAKNEHQAVTFVSFACSGAQVLGGVLGPQPSPPGVADFGAPPGPKFHMRSQLEDALKLLCDGNLKDVLPPETYKEYYGLAANLQVEPDIQSEIRKYKTPLKASCKDDHFTARPVDAVLLSIGGNDIGFAGSVKYALLPRQASDPVGQSVLSFVREKIGVTPPYQARRAIDHQLSQLLPELDKALRTGLAPPAVPVILNQYPNPLVRFDAGSANVDQVQSEHVCSGYEDSQLFGALNGVFPDNDISPDRRWRIQVSADQAQDVASGVLAPLDELLRKMRTGEAGAWRVLDLPVAVSHRGWCALGAGESTDQFTFPSLVANGQNWFPREHEPWKWDPYAPRGRLFRTANDVVLTQIGSDAPVVPVPILSSFANRSFFALAGMIHPTAEAHFYLGSNAADKLIDELPDPNPPRER